MSESADQSANCTAAKSGAMAAVLGITELLEEILQHLDATTLLRAQRVNRRWQDLIQCLIRINVIVRKKLFLVPAEVEEVLNGNLKTGREDHDLYILFAEPGESHTGPRGAMLNPWLKWRGSDDAQIRMTDDAVELGGHAVKRLIDARDLRAQMLFSQPPTKGITCSIQLAEQVKVGTGRYGFHTTEDLLHVAMKGSERSDRSSKGIAGLVAYAERKIMRHWGCTIDWQTSTHDRSLRNGKAAAGACR